MNLAIKLFLNVIYIVTFRYELEVEVQIDSKFIVQCYALIYANKSE